MKLNDIKNRFESYGLRPEDWDIIDLEGGIVKFKNFKEDKLLFDFNPPAPTPPKETFFKKGGAKK